MATQTAGDVLVDTLIDWGVDTVFGIPGDGINGIMESLAQAAGRDPLHPGAPRGGGRLHGLRLRQMDRQARRVPRDLRARRHPPAQRPLRRQARRPAGARDHRPAVPRPAPHVHAAGRRARQAVHGRGVYNARVMGPAHVENVVELACRTALAYRGVAHVTIPVDMQDRSVSTRHALRAQHPASRLRRAWRARRALPSEAQLARGRRDPERRQEDRDPRRPRRARRGATSWRRSPSGSARRSSSRCSARPRARRQPLYDRRHRPARHRPSQEALEDCDTLLIVGSSFPYIEFYPKPGQARAVQIDIDPQRIGLRYPVEAGLVGDTRARAATRCCRSSTCARTAASSRRRRTA